MLKFNLNFVFMLINLVILFLLMRRFLFRPIKRTMDKRKELIEQQFKNAEDANAAAEAKMSDYENRIAGVEQEAEAIITDAKKSARAEYDKIIDRAEADAESIKVAAKKQSDEACENQLRKAKEDIAALAIETAEKVLGKSVSAETDSDIFNEFLNEGSEENESQN